MDSKSPFHGNAAEWDESPPASGCLLALTVSLAVWSIIFWGLS
jgi:hypothetical protein